MQVQAAAQRVNRVPITPFGTKTPLPTQWAFLNDTLDRKVYIGNIGSGKTEVLCWQAIILSHYYAPNCGLIARFTYPELRDTTRKRFIQICPPNLIRSASLPEHGGGGYVDWVVGGVTLFRNMDRPENSLSLDLGYAGIDEITECPYDSYMMLEARLPRHWTTMGVSVYPYSPLFGTGNPGGNDWVKRLFFGPKSRAEGFGGHHPTPRENEVNLPPNYYANKSKGKPDWWVRRFINGELGEFTGLIWPTFEERVNVVRPFPLPYQWARVMGMDHGKNNPTAATWFAIDPDRNLILYRNYRFSGPTVAEHAKRLLALDRKERVVRRIGDPSMFRKDQSRGDKWYSIAQMYDEYGLDLEPGDNAMHASLERVNQLLWADPTHPFPAWHPKAGQLGSPRMFFFSTCQEAIDEVSNWKFKPPRKDGSLREEPVDHENDLCDTIRYVALSFEEPTPEPAVVPEPTPGTWQRERLRRIARQIATRNRSEKEPPDDDEYV